MRRLIDGSIALAAAVRRNLARPHEHVFVGPAAFGAVKMRGCSIAAQLGMPFFEPAVKPKSRVIYLVKSAQGYERQIRRSCHVLVYEPLDSWMSDPVLADSSHGYTGPTSRYWQSIYERIRFDVLVVSTPSAAADARSALPSGVQVECLPHHADSRVGTWHDAAGDVVYPGNAQYIADWVDTITSSCASIGRNFRFGNDLAVMQGAALVLALRLPPSDTPINQLAKPQIKIENAIAAGIPVLASPHACVTSLFPSIATTLFPQTDRLAAEMTAAMARGPEGRRAVSLNDHCAGVHALLRSL
jgi:hypothetical protein